MFEGFNLEDIITLNPDEEIIEVDDTSEDKDDLSKPPIEDEEGEKEKKEEDSLNIDIDSFNNDTQDEEEEDEKSIQLSNLYTSLKETNHLLVDDTFEFDNTPEKLTEAIDITFDKLKDNARESLLNSLSEEDRLALKYSLTYKKPLYSYYEENEFANVDYESFDLNEEADQREIVRAYLQKTTSLSEQKINKQVELLEKSGQLVIEAKDYYNELISIQEKEKEQFESKLEQDRIKALQDIQKIKSERVEAIKKLTDIDETRKKKLTAFVANEVYLNGRNKNATTELNHFLNSILRNPEHLAQLADIVVDYDPEKGLVLDRIVAKVSTKKAEELKNKLDAKSGLPKGQQQVRKKSNDQEFNWDEWAKQL